MATVKNTAETVRELIAPVAQELGYEIWDVVYEKEGSRWYLRVTIDTDAELALFDGCGFVPCGKTVKLEAGGGAYLRVQD